MAQWSTKRMEAEQQLKAELAAKKLAAMFAERDELFKRFRDGGWEVCVLNPVAREEVKLRDHEPSMNPDYLVKMPGARAMRIRTIAQLYRLAKGVE
jgi:hypothetical protein